MPGNSGNLVRLRHVLEAIETIEGYIAGTDFDGFVSNSMMLDACIRQLQVVGESCRSVTIDLRQKYPDIPWKQIVGLRIIVIHEYFGIDINVIWEIIQDDLPSFKIQVLNVLESES